jgi:hypothetical protein
LNVPKLDTGLALLRFEQHSIRLQFQLDVQFQFAVARRVECAHGTVVALHSSRGHQLLCVNDFLTHIEGAEQVLAASIAFGQICFNGLRWFPY